MHVHGFVQVCVRAWVGTIAPMREQVHMLVRQCVLCGVCVLCACVVPVCCVVCVTHLPLDSLEGKVSGHGLPWCPSFAYHLPIKTWLLW